MLALAIISTILLTFMGVSFLVKAIYSGNEDFITLTCILEIIITGFIATMWSLYAK